MNDLTQALARQMRFDAARRDRRERLREFVQRYDCADGVDVESQVDLTLELLRRAAAARRAAAGAATS